jgi:hypothetical protein
MRRGAALAGRATEQLAGGARGSLALAGGPQPSRHGAKRRRRCPTRTRWGGPARARWTWWPRRCGCPAVPSSACRCSRPAASVQCPVSGVRCPVSGVRCGRPASRVPVHAAGVRCPAWVSGVRGFPRPVSGRQVVEGGAGARSRRMAGMAGSAWWPAVSTASSSAARVGTWRSRLAQAVLGQRRRRPWTSPSSWELVGVVAGSTAWATGMGWMGAGIARWWRAGVRSEVATTLRGHRARPRAGSPGRCKPPGLDCDLRARPWCGRSMRRAPPARRWRRSDLQCWGWR